MANGGEELKKKRAASTRKRRKEKPELFAQYDKTKYNKIRTDPEKLAKERERQLVKQKKAYQKDPEKYKVRAREYNAKNKDKVNEQCREYKRRNPDVVKRLNQKWNHISRNRRKKRVPCWLNESHLNEMRAMYKKARDSGMHVDHIVPLQGKLVSGLHVPWNLQLLSPSENCSKRNSFEVL